MRCRFRHTQTALPTRRDAVTGLLISTTLATVLVVTPDFVHVMQALIPDLDLSVRAQGQPVAEPSTNVSLRLQPPTALDKRGAGKTEDFRTYIMEVRQACGTHADYAAGMLSGMVGLADSQRYPTLEAVMAGRDPSTSIPAGGFRRSVLNVLHVRPCR